MRVPFCENAVVDIRKLTEYVLNPNHEDGKHKARMFKSVLNLSAKDAGPLRIALLEAVKTNDAVLGRTDDYGQRYTVDFYYEWKGKSAVLRSGWIIEFESETPRLTTCFPL